MHWRRSKKGRQVYDDISGQELDGSMVMMARAEEMEELRRHGVYVKAPLTQCRDRTGKEPIGVRWVDVNKGDKVHPEYRSRLVAEEIKVDKR